MRLEFYLFVEFIAVNFLYPRDNKFLNRFRSYKKLLKVLTAWLMHYLFQTNEHSHFSIIFNILYRCCHSCKTQDLLFARFKISKKMTIKISFITQTNTFGKMAKIVCKLAHGSTEKKLNKEYENHIHFHISMAISETRSLK